MKAVMFSGQGAQKMGMGQGLYNNFAICRDTFAEASEALGMDMARLCFEEKELLMQTEYAQPALLTAGIAAYRLLVSQGFAPGVLMGLSLGEYTALTAAGALDFADALRLVHTRGRLMAQYGRGGMLAAIGVPEAKLEAICQHVSPIGFAACANYNTPAQTVLAGEQAALDTCVAEIKQAGGKAMPLKVSGAFHTPLMQDAAERFAGALVAVKVKAADIPVISNVDGNVFDTGRFVQILTAHMTSPVRWVDCVENAVGMGADTFVELGSGKTLVSFVKQINGDVQAFTVESVEDLP
jgi:[acyl-carrier-protein] S-malonyltransferase